VKPALLIAAGAIAYVVDVAIATAALSRTDRSEGTSVPAGPAFCGMG
jgi:hypothetical protein